MRVVAAHRVGRWTLLGLLALTAALVLGAQSGSAGRDEGPGKGPGPNGKALGHAKKADPPAPPSFGTPPPASPAPPSPPTASPAPASGGSSTSAARPSSSVVAAGAAASNDGDIFVVTVNPEELSALTGTSVVVTAHLTDGGGGAIAGEPIHFKVSGVNSDTANGRTDGSGNVSYTAASAAPGTDVVTACLHRDESSKGSPEDDDDTNEAKKYCDTATIHWVTAPTDLGVVLTGPASVTLGDEITLTALVTNNGPGVASGVTLAYAPPGGLAFVSASVTKGSCSGNAPVLCVIGTLASGESATASIVVRGAAVGSHTSSVGVDLDQADPVSVNDTSSVATEVTVPDVSVSFSADPRSVVVGDTIILTSVVTNNGPGTATGVVLAYDVPSGLELQSVSTTQGSCSGTAAVECEIGALDPGDSATVTMVVKALATGSYSNVVDVTGDQPDSGGNGNNTGTVVTTVEKPADTNVNFIPLEELEAPFTPPLVGPVQGKNVDVEPVSGEVLVKLKGKKKFVPLTDERRIPVGSSVDVTDGVVKLTSATDRKGRVQAAVFYDGMFVVKQKKRALTELVLAGGDFSDCDESEAERTAQSHKRKPRQKLWGNGTGQFQTSGQFSSATVRGTKWYVVDTCTGTLTVVVRGVVKVYDSTLKRYFVLRAGQRHWARAPKD